MKGWPVDPSTAQYAYVNPLDVDHVRRKYPHVEIIESALCPAGTGYFTAERLDGLLKPAPEYPELA